MKASLGKRTEERGEVSRTLTILSTIGKREGHLQDTKKMSSIEKGKKKDY